MVTATLTKEFVPAVLDIWPVDPKSDKEDMEQLENHLLQAAYLEMSTVPMYLYALLSIETRGYSQWDPGMGASRLIRSIVVEEMLHLSLVRNILVAIGARKKIKFYDKKFVPAYPSLMLHRWPELTLHLGPCSKKLVKDVFMEFELPRQDVTTLEAIPDGWYRTIGEFYQSVGERIKALDKKTKGELWQTKESEFQYVEVYWNKDGGGEPVLVHDLKSAQDAVKIIVEQGEGIDPKSPSVPIDPLNPKPGLDELPHYTKFKRIADGVEPLGNVYNLPTDPKSTDYDKKREPAAHAINTLFNAAYCYTLHMLDVIYETSWKDLAPGKENHRYHLERTFISLMQGVLVTVAETMVASELNIGPLIPQNPGPTFEFYQLPATGKKAHLIDLCEQAMHHFPQLGGDNSVLWLLNKMPDV
ncbi:ferritin-like domain-containing protein [Streptomyces halobius]|uniref:Ferritin-like protein n=1 Tax=Streptomyces halobius TaxID=2879846 RepID=A0ABY4MHW8_9ACTN|nr:ferritin-like protein [Streptomyces halobius]UQA97400.1 ferritin-like protein [Streptomyces halobius]